ncbi:type III secretion protein [Burkholderia ubonensis]|uniref:EscU/YscU/HrcU family type III secretion system export apparatus switch protein n=1 Tax=Burkholderia ubonensis TaxID=101571 RepID=UPI0007556827|nr:EscU/YscU/HrcU family type III secretion system export apparatus switch protein [Burkholderia ubonensis]KVD76193.1 type III secretion protein [Burkholderia ubonensis]
MSEKTEHPTDSRLRQARKDGQIPKSRDLTQALVGVVWPLAFSTVFYMGVGRAVHWVQGLLARIGEGFGHDSEWVDSAIIELIVPSFILCACVAMFGAFFAIVFESFQARGLLSMRPVTPNFGKLNPVSQLKNICSLRTLVELAKNLVKVTVIGVCTFVVIQGGLPDLVGLSRVDAPAILKVTTDMLFKIALSSAGVLVLLAVIDVGYQRYEYIKNLKMTKDEVKRDYKQQEGDPLIKGERRRLHAELTDF